MNVPSLVLPATDGSLELRFHHRGDRWHHALVWQQGGHTQPLLTSLEGDDSQPWPPSPPIQELDPHQIDGATVLLGVGMAGRSHWSLSASQAGNELLLEWACLVHPPAGPLGTTYDIPGAGSDWQFPTDPETHLQFPLPGSEALLSIRPAADTRVEWPTSPQPRLSLQPAERPANPSPTPRQTSCRWSLQLALSQPG